MSSTTRIFATVEAFRLACPRCNQISVIEPLGVKHTRRTATLLTQARKGNRSQRAFAHVRQGWDARHQVLKCPWCGIVWQIGLVVRPKAPGQRRERPADVVPTRKELDQLRNRYAGGWWIDEPHKADEPVNLHIPEECSCAPDPWSASCPVHGRERIGEL